MKIYFTLKSVEVKGNDWIPAGVRWYAEPTSASIPHLRGYPVGRGYSDEAAVADLKERIRDENDWEHFELLEVKLSGECL